MVSKLGLHPAMEDERATKIRSTPSRLWCWSRMGFNRYGAAKESFGPHPCPCFLRGIPTLDEAGRGRTFMPRRRGPTPTLTRSSSSSSLRKFATSMLLKSMKRVKK
ncbi:hypothetical protein Pint_07681 [Pistacia integerrima]|uniref:Uncharacterized protein n=1 Tax=Pistacia integerrima TaxID=434235 RepID=A0ACC0XSS9_9ROSI|nr:hypothetical protein Pint_07681 [Pistacia integerrima]